MVRMTREARMQGERKSEGGGGGGRGGGRGGGGRSKQQRPCTLEQEEAS